MATATSENVQLPGLRGFFRLGGLLIAIGAVLLTGRFSLVALGGSWYYVLAGVGLVVSGGYLLKARLQELLIYLAVYAGTWIWVVSEVGFDSWLLVPRVVTPSVLLLFVLPCLPGLLRRPALVGLVALLAAPLPGAGQAQTAPRLVGVDWPTYGDGHDAMRHSPLATITPENVADIEEVWSYCMGDLPPDDEKYTAETIPLVIDGRMYLCTALNSRMALDAATGMEIWRFEASVTEDFLPYNTTCRGGAYFETEVFASQAAEPISCAARVIQSTLNACLIALDATTGARCPDFGTNGAVDLLGGFGDPAPGFLTVPTSPAIVRGVIVVGHQLRDGQHRAAPTGVVRGYDALPGNLRWAWDMLRPGEMGLPPRGETWSVGTPKMWTIASGDEALGLVYLPVGKSAINYYGAPRSDVENAYATSLVALDVETGAVRWSFQTVPYDVWDYDLGSHATLVDFQTERGPAPALILPSKQEDIYILDRATGEPLTPVEDQPSPSGGVELQDLSPTQPFSGYHTLAKRDLNERDMWGMSPIDPLWRRIQLRRAQYHGIYTPPTTNRSWIQYPGYNGRSDWGGATVDPERRVILASYNDIPNHNRLIPREEIDAAGVLPEDWDPQVGAHWDIAVNAGWRMQFTGLLCGHPPYGGIRAIDLATGQTRWDQPLGTARKNGPIGLPSYLPFPISTPNNAGAVVTASDFVFIAAATDDLIQAIDIKTGEILWRASLPVGGQATPITYEVEGRQYIAIMAGGHSFMETPIRDHVIAYALPDR